MAAVEPIGSAMTFQAQPVQSAQTAKAEQIAVSKPAAEFTETDSEIAAPVDGKTIVVDSVKESDGENDSYNNSQQSMQQKKEASNEQIKKAVEELNKKMANSEVLYGIHEGTRRVTIKVVDKDTKEVIREYPPEKTLDMIAKVWEMAGIMVDEKR